MTFPPVTMFLIPVFPVSILSIAALSMVSIMMRGHCILALIFKLGGFLGGVVVLWTSRSQSMQGRFWVQAPDCLLCKVPVGPSGVT